MPSTGATGDSTRPNILLTRREWGELRSVLSAGAASKGTLDFAGSARRADRNVLTASELPSRAVCCGCKHLSGLK